MFNGEEFGKQIVTATISHVDKSVAPLLKEIETLKAEIAALKAVPLPKDGKDADPAAVAAIVDAKFYEDITELKSAFAAIPAPLELPDIPAMISEAVEAAKPEPVDYTAIAKAQIEIAIAAIPDPLPFPELPDIPAMILEAVLPLTESIVAVELGYKHAISNLLPAEKGKDADPAIIEALVQEYVGRAVETMPVPRNGDPGADGVSLEDLLPVIGQEVAKAVAAIPAPKDGRNGVDLADMLVVEGGDVVATFTDGRTKLLGPFRGKDGKDGKDIDLAEIERLIAEKVAKITPPEVDAYLSAFAPDDVAANISLAVKMMAQMPQTQILQDSKAQPINVSVTMPEMKASDTTVNVSLPEQQPPVVTVEPSVVNVAPANVHIETRRGKEVTKVTGWDKNGRITSFEKTEEE